MADDFEDRPTRRHVLLNSVLTVGGQRTAGYASNVSIGGIFVRVGRDVAPTVRVGSTVGIEFDLPTTAEPIVCSAKIAWIKVDDFDAEGHPVMGLGLTFVDLGTQHAVRIESFVKGFRYSIAAIASEPTALAELSGPLGKDYRILMCSSLEETLHALENNEIAAAVIDHSIEETQGEEILNEIMDRLPRAHVVRTLPPSAVRPDSTHEFLRTGKVVHPVAKPFDNQELAGLIRRAVEAYSIATERTKSQHALKSQVDELRRENVVLREQLSEPPGFERITGNSVEIRKAIDQMQKVMHSDVTVHIRGETGTGKELFLRALHDGGPRRKGPLVAQNCAGLSETLLQSTLFGHKRGSFTGADRDHPGVFQQAHGGTLFLDEVAELTAQTQASLLRALQERQVMPIGGTRPINVDVRFVSATHKDIWEHVQQGKFREDLYYRLVVVTIVIPPLRKRAGDISLLASHFLEEYARKQGKAVLGFTREALMALEGYHWPGNVRQLENEVERSVLMAEPGKKIPLELLSERISERQKTRKSTMPPREGVTIPSHLPYDEAVELLQRTLIERAIKKADGVVSTAADNLRVERSRLAKIRRRLGLE